jgi:hypothetical protein
VALGILLSRVFIVLNFEKINVQQQQRKPAAAKNDTLPVARRFDNPQHDP